MLVRRYDELCPAPRYHSDLWLYQAWRPDCLRLSEAVVHTPRHGPQTLSLGSARPPPPSSPCSSLASPTAPTRTLRTAVLPASLLLLLLLLGTAALAAVRRVRPRQRSPPPRLRRGSDIEDLDVAWEVAVPTSSGGGVARRRQS